MIRGCRIEGRRGDGGAVVVRRPLFIGEITEFECLPILANGWNLEMWADALLFSGWWWFAPGDDGP